MTEHDLATMLRHHVADDPPFDDHAANAVLSRGRRNVRRTRLTIAAGGLAACVLATAVGAPYLTRSDTGPDRLTDPAVAKAIAAYDVTKMPATMDERARTVLKSSVPDLGEADFVAFDSQYQQLPEEYWDKASGLVVRYGLGTPHQVSVTVQHARGLAEGDANGFCDQVVAAGWYMECNVSTSADGDVAITTLGAESLRQPRGRGLQRWSDQFSAVTPEDLGSVPSDRLWFSRDVKVIKSDTFVTYVSEKVQAPDLATARDKLLVPVDDLESIGLDPALVMPKPPPGENGCPQWTMPTMEVSCTGAG